MDEFEELFGEWGMDASGEPLPLTIETYRGPGQSGPKYDAPQSLPGLPQIPDRRRVVTSDGVEHLSSTVVYAPIRLREHFTLGSRVTLASGVVVSILDLSTPDVEGIFSYVQARLQ